MTQTNGCADRHTDTHHTHTHTHTHTHKQTHTDGHAGRHWGLAHQWQQCGLVKRAAAITAPSPASRATSKRDVEKARLHSMYV